MHYPPTAVILIGQLFFVLVMGLRLEQAKRSKLHRVPSQRHAWDRLIFGLGKVTYVVDWPSTRRQGRRAHWIHATFSP